MKPLLWVVAAVFLVLVSISLLACGDARSSMSFPEYETAMRNAKKDGKPILLYFFSKYCRYCRVMERETLADREITEILADFHVVTIDADRYSALVRRYSVVGFPSCWFLDTSGKRILEAPGYLEKTLFKKVLEYIRGKHYKSKDINEYLKRRAGV
jgi:thioredoxin-related protein